MKTDSRKLCYGLLDEHGFGFPTEIIAEGTGSFLVPKLRAFVTKPSDYAPSKAPVFYNPVMELNRDFAVLALQAYQKAAKLRLYVCEPLASSGIRGIRFAKEVSDIKKIVMNDINTQAVNLINYNIRMNNVRNLASAKHGDANLLLAQHSTPHRRFDAIDIDPFGSPVPYLDSAVRALKDNGLIALTATDMAPLCGVHPKACLRKYGGRPLRTEYCHELAVRLLTGALATTAAKHSIGIKLQFCHSVEHYIRIYAVARHGAKQADDALKKMGHIFHCFNCLHREVAAKPFMLTFRSECPECHSQLASAGPLWIGSLSDREFCEAMTEDNERRNLRNRSKINKILTLSKDEEKSPATYFVHDKVCDKLGIPVPPLDQVVTSIRTSGFEAGLTHFNSKGIKTDAPAKEVAKCIRTLSTGLREVK